jgi:mevalonate kinase
VCEALKRGFANKILSICWDCAFLAVYLQDIRTSKKIKIMNFSTRTNGKLLLTGEYFVTEGAVALALPTRLGQSLNAMRLAGRKDSILQWQSYDSAGELWFESEFTLGNFDIIDTSAGSFSQDIAEVLQDIFRAARRLNPEFLNHKESVSAETILEFPRQWGLGTSSTLVSMIAEWANIDAFELLALTMGGSGYDIAAARADAPILFQKFNGKNRWEAARFDPPFKNNLYFVYLGKKQDSRLAMVYYSTAAPETRHKHIGRITQISHNVAALREQPQLASVANFAISHTGVAIDYPQPDSLSTFEALLAEHEQIVQSVIQQPRAKDLYFSDYWGEIKSLGAWGGDFVLATSARPEAETRQYFADKGFDTVLSYTELIK